ncbi:hypothetical protein KAT08_04610, partial [Candidatus Babeliales bacterium]|nr:hypothetical protein [Candidatus Babeliales bacterium]
VFGVQENQVKKIIEKFSLVVNEKMIGTKEFGALIRQALQEVPYEELMYAEITQQSYGAALPKIAEYRSAYFKEKSFPDCADTTQRNLVNIFLYQKENKIFSIMNLSVDSKIKEFYDPKNKSSDPEKKKNLCMLSEEVENQAVHNAWTKVIPGRPFVSYNRILDTDTKKVYLIGVASTYVGAITGFSKKTDFGEFKKHVKWLDEISLLGKDFDCVEILGHKYIVVDDLKCYALYEIRPSIKNVIILIDQFLGLNVYKDKKIEKAFADPKFNKKYFDVLCDELDWHVDTMGLGDLDKRDYSTIGINIPVSIKSGEQFTISISLGHAYVKKTKKVALRDYQKNIFERALNFFDSKAGKVEGIRELDLFQICNFLELYNDESGFDKMVQLVKNISWFQKYLFFLRDVLDNNVKVDVIKKILAGNHERLMGFAEKLIISLPVRQDFHYQSEIVGYITKDLKGVSIENKNKLLNALLFAKGFKESQLNYYKTEVFFPVLDYSDLGDNVLKEIIKVVQDSIKSKIKVEREEGFELLIRLVEKGHCFDLAIKNLQDLIKSKIKAEREKGFELLKKLVEKGHGFDLAIEVIKELIERGEDKKNKYNALVLCKELVEKGHCFDQATKIAQDTIEHKDRVINILGLRIFTALIEQGCKGINEKAIKAAQKSMESKDSNKREEVLKLFTVLVKKWKEINQKAINQAITLAQESIKSLVTSIRKEALGLFKVLFEKKLVVDQAKEKALVLELKKSQDKYIRSTGEDLLKMMKEE